MREVEKIPKSIKKTVRYIKQDSSKEELSKIKKIIEDAIERRTYLLK
ncbi:MAG: hypothetical protein ACK4M9_04550 [Anaerobacillus sp.]